MVGDEVLLAFFSSAAPPSLVEGEGSVLLRGRSVHVVEVPQAPPRPWHVLRRALLAGRTAAAAAAVVALEHVGHWKHVGVGIGHLLHFLCHCSCLNLWHHSSHNVSHLSLLLLLGLELLLLLLLLLLLCYLLLLVTEEACTCTLDVLGGLALLEVGAPVVLDLVVRPPREAPGYRRPSVHRFQNFPVMVT